MEALRIDIVTLFPHFFPGPLGESMMQLAADKGAVEFSIVNLRDFAEGKHRVTDDYPYGGGAGMVVKPGPVVRAIEALSKSAVRPATVVMLTPSGRRFDQKMAETLAEQRHIIFVCGHYRGFDERVRDVLRPMEISIGDYVLTGGEPAALVVCDAVVRLVPGVLGNPESPVRDSFSTGMLDHAHYTRPPTFRGLEVPPVLLSGNHEEIRVFRRRQALRRTVRRRPELLHREDMNDEDRRLLEDIAREEKQDVEMPVKTR